MTRLMLSSIGGLILFILVLVHDVDGGAVMSIDFGAEWMKVGVVSPGIPMEIALNKESKRKTPTVIAYHDGTRTFGEDAQSIGIRFPVSAYFYLLDLLGKTVDNPIVKLYKKRFPYYEIIGDEERNTVVFKNGDQLFRVEELVAQLLLTAKEFAEKTAKDQTITECVLVVPGYFGQAERFAMLTAAQLAGLKVLQLINDYTAVALNYGVFRGKEINETEQYYIFYDMGAQKTTASLVGFQLVKDKTTREVNPVIKVLGVGYDRTLGGLEIQLRLRDFLAEEFNKMKKTKTNVFKNHRAMAKLFKEAGRVKNVLSANADHYAQIENLLEEHDFKFQVTREHLEKICSDLWPRVVKPLEQALKIAGLSLDIVNQVILVGGGTRVPKVQEILKNTIKQELGKNLNADEAATMGAIYKAADLATGFKVKKYVVKDAVIYPMQVIYERETNEGQIKEMKKILFGLMNSYPQRKVITFNKHVNDFDFYVNFDLNHLSSEETSYIGSLNVSRIELRGISELLEKHKDENTEPKGIKAHFSIDDSGIFNLTEVNFVFEKQKVGGSDEEGTLSKLGSTISKLFSGDKTKDEEVVSEQNEEKPLQNVTEKSNASNATDNTKEEKQPTETTKNETVKIVTVKVPVTFNYIELFTKPFSGKAYEESYKKLEDINKAERDRSRRELAFNALESFVIDMQDKLANEEFSSCAVEEEKKKILDECSITSGWLYEEGVNADADIHEKRLSELKSIANEVLARHWEHRERPEALNALDGIIEGATKFLKNAKTLTKEANPDKDIFTQVEIETLEKAIDETHNWKKVETDAQNKLKKHENVRLTVKDIYDRMDFLDREVKYLINKIKIWRPKKPLKKEDNDKVDANGTDSESPEVKKSESPEDQGEPVTTDGPTLNETSATPEKVSRLKKPSREKPGETETTTPHGEL